MAEAGCELLGEYVSCHGKMSCRCSCGRPWSVNLTNFLQGKRCADCGGVRKYTYDEVKKAFQDGGCDLLSGEYKGVHCPLDYICSCGEQDQISYGSFAQGRRCKKCWYRKVRDRLSTGLEGAREEFRSRGCTLLEEVYVNARVPMRYRCSCGEESKICLYSLKNGNRCKKCWVIRNSGEGNKKWKKDRKAHKEDLAFRHRCRRFIHETFFRVGVERTDKIRKLIGYGTHELKAHITSHVNWERVRDGRWSIDHFFPVQAFLDYGIRDIALINALDNLQPLLLKDNISKSDKYDVLLFEDWLAMKNVSFKRPTNDEWERRTSEGGDCRLRASPPSLSSH